MEEWGEGMGSHRWSWPPFPNGSMDREQASVFLKKGKRSTGAELHLPNDGLEPSAALLPRRTTILSGSGVYP